MPKLVVKPVDKIAKKWVDVTPGRAAYYEAGVKAPLKNWEENTVAQAAAYKGAVTAPNIDKMFTGGVKKAGFAKWQRKATEVGASRFGPGVQAAAPDYQAGFAPYAETLATVEVPARGPRGADINFEKVKKIGQELMKKRLALRAAGT
ncbi:MAG: hypothetical protein ACPLZY_04750 [Candidatus Norongarragalinales archaeon]